MKIETYYGKDLEKLSVRQIEMNADPVFTIDDFPVMLDNMYLLSSEDRDLMLMFFFSRKKQEDIGRLCGVTQAAVSYQMRKMKTRMLFIKRLRRVQKRIAEFFEYLGKFDFPDQFLEAAVLMFFTTSQTYSANMLGVKQATVRYRFNSFVELLGTVKIPKHFLCVARYFKALLSNHNMVMRIRRN